MEKLRTSLTIIGHSLDILGRHPRLIVFPLLSLVVLLPVFAFFVAPQFLGVLLAETWHAIWESGEARDVFAAVARTFAPGTSPRVEGSFPGLAAGYLLCMLIMTFFNVALYSQVIEAMNGGRVSVPQGLTVASSRLPAIAAWSMLAGTVGLVLGTIQERTSVLGRWLTQLVGISWSAASVFVIPAMINEPRSRSPFEYLKISTALLRRVWGEGVVGLAGVAWVAVLVTVCVGALNIGVAVTSHLTHLRIQIVFFDALIVFGIVGMLYLAYQIFKCGLYVYATQGVAPGTFDDEIFERAWTVRRGAPGTAGDEKKRPAAPRVPWARLRPLVLVPVAMAGAVMLGATLIAKRENVFGPASWRLVAPVQRSPEPASVFSHFPRTTVFVWDAVPGAVSYTFEVDCFHYCGLGKWCADVGSKCKIVPDLDKTTYSFDWMGAQPGRWRVWAVDESGRRGQRSGWSEFKYTR